MKTPARLALLVIALALCLGFGFLLRADLFEYVVRPVAVLGWLLWRVVLSVDQGVYWGVLIAAALVYVARRPLQKPFTTGQVTVPRENTVLDSVDHWRSLIFLTADEASESNLLKRYLEQMLVAVYVSKQPGARSLDIHNALQRREIPLPEDVYAFLYPPEPSGSRRTLWQILEAIWRAPRTWVSRWTGRDVAEYYRSIENVIAHIDSTLEIKS